MRRGLGALLLLLALGVIAWVLLGRTSEDPGASTGSPSVADRARLEREFGAAALDLLVRRPDEVFEAPGPIVARADVEWGAYGGPGWDRSNPDQVLADGRPWIRSNQPVASLRLPAPAPRDRTLALEVWCPAPAPAPNEGTPVLRPSLNGVALGEHALGHEPAALRLEVPAPVWRLGENRLELSLTLDAGGAADAEPGPWTALALARVDYGEERRVRCELAAGAEAGRVELAATTGVRYAVETEGVARLWLAGDASGPGTLNVRLATQRARDGVAVGEPEVTPLAVEGEVNRVFALPAVAPGELLSIDLDWQAREDAATFALERARVLEREPRPRPNVVLVSIDTLSARHLSVHGYERPTTPNLEALARDAVLFERCIANAPWTLPSYLSALTGLYPLAHFVTLEHAPGVALDNYDYWQAAKSRWTLAEAFRARGYQTAAAVDTDWLSPRFHVDQGFDVYDTEPAGYPFSDPTKGIQYILWRFGPWLDEARSLAAPFFVFIHALDAHGPYWPEAPFYRSFQDRLPAEPRMAPAGSAPQTFGAVPDWMAYSSCPVDRRLGVAESWPVPPELDVEEIVARYDESILKTDAALGDLFAMLKERGLYDDAVIVITGDHGESFDHGAYSHGVMWEAVVHVPLILKLPGNELGGTRVERSVQLVDLYPTLLELAGAGAARDYLHGRSLLAVRAGELEARPTFSQGGHIDQAMIEHEGWKLVEAWPGRGGGVSALLTHPRVRTEQRAWLERHAPEILAGEIFTEELAQRIRERPGFAQAFAELRERVHGPYYELYDLTTDPEERHDRAAAEPERVARLKERLTAEIERARAAQADGRPEPPTQDFSPEELERLRELGYTGDE